eukprot:1581028-Ditylum_brightwellii.AAC.1
MRDISKPVTPTNVGNILIDYALVSMDINDALIIDIGVSQSITFCASGVIGGIYPPSLDILAGLSEKSQVKGGDIVHWHVHDDYGHMHTIETKVYYVPQACVCLFSPQT